ncbi:propionyl-CoA synthetase [Pseudoclavibacter chungangensis]|uniref:Propionyl-CoA synthetase n=1 Tax=Pseudoclavibacter chungangensis TaxID=587635 RepID=A0A7J5BPS7_9MICO|nr:AMP-binding protein [Pseudoclavibacter chungangensis]KAB1655354.1 propionyl-CoA synthetase [Pseudoclavibacter chungangensis]NYJ68304.1 propionyl-CoA synthetase [Pseudoclavibacter chungangensis]
MTATPESAAAAPPGSTENVPTDRLRNDRYADVWRRSIEDPEAFWLETADLVEWTTKPTSAIEITDGSHWRWFPGGELNTSVNCLDRHVRAGRGDAPAVIYDSAMTGTKKQLTYAELLDRVARFAGALRDAGVEAGDRVVIYLPMIPEAIVAMLACARIGAIHSVVFGGFAASELAVRLRDATPKVVVTASGGLEPGRTVEYLPIVARALELGGASVETVFVTNRPLVPGSAADYADHEIRFIDWTDAEAAAEPADPMPVASEHPAYILYTSGTTGNPKGIVRDTGGHAVALTRSMSKIYGIEAGDVWWSASDVGWVVGHSYIVYGPLLAGATTIIYEGKPVGTPDAGAFWRIVEEYGVKALFTAPTAVRAVRREDPALTHLGRYDISSLEALFLAGERLDPETYHWANDGIHCPVIDHWWQTETGWPICVNPRGIELLPAKPGSTSVPCPGVDLRVLDASGADVTDPGTEGNLALTLPLPPGYLLGVWGDESRFRDAYLKAFPGYYATGDSGYVDEDGFVFVMGRTDDVINVAGHRLSTGSLEEVLTLHDAVAEAAVVGVADAIKGQRAVGFVTLKHGHERDPAVLRDELVALVREHIGPVAAFREVHVLAKLPKTRSGKVLRKTIRQIFDGEDYLVPATIEDPAAIHALVAIAPR